MKLTTIALFCLLLFSNCRNQASTESEEAKPAVDLPAAAMEMPPSNTDKTAPESSSSGNKSIDPKSIEKPIEKNYKIIKDGVIDLEVKNINEVKKSLDVVVKKLNAYYEIDEYSSSDYNSNYNIKIRIKSDNFEALTDGIQGLNAIVKHKDIRARDVTEEYTDTESRLNSGKAYIVRYKDLLTKAHNIKDIIEIENIIQEKQAEIEANEGRLKLLNDQIAYSTLTINITENHEFYNAKSKENFLSKIGNAFKQGLDILLSIILTLITLWPILLFMVVPFIYRKRIIGYFRRERV